MYPPITKTQLEAQLQEAIDTISNSPDKQICLELQNRNYVINKVINSCEDFEYKLGVLNIVNQNMYFKTTILHINQLQNQKSANIYHNISEFLKINDCGHVVLTKNTKGLIKMGNIDIIMGVMNEIEALCDNYFYIRYIVKIYKNLYFDKDLIFRSSSIKKMQTNLESFIRICNRIVKSLRKINRRITEYLDFSPIKSELDRISSLRLQLYLSEC